MDDIDIMPNDSLSQFSVMVSGQQIDESISTHGTAQTPGGNILEDVDETGTIDQYFSSADSKLSLNSAMNVLWRKQRNC